jgi:hypothetical protein
MATDDAAVVHGRNNACPGVNLYLQESEVGYGTCKAHPGRRVFSFLFARGTAFCLPAL